MLSDLPTASEADALVAHVKRVASGQAGPAVPLKLALRVLLRASSGWGATSATTPSSTSTSAAAASSSSATRGQLADWLWILRSHGPPNGENVS